VALVGVLSKLLDGTVTETVVWRFDKAGETIVNANMSANNCHAGRF
jgi:hypothetical protein